MTTPPSADDTPNDPEADPDWAPPDAPAAAPVPPASTAGEGAPAEPPDILPAPAAIASGPPAPAPDRTNRLAIAALVTGLVGLILLAVAFAIAALVQAGRRGEKGKGLAIGALAASTAWAAAIAAILTILPSEDLDDSAPSGTYGQPRASTLKTGTCFIAFEEKSTAIFMKATPCNHGHEGAVAAQRTLPDGPFPGDEAVLADAEEMCQDRTRFLEKTGRADEFRLYIDRPDEQAWGRGNRTVTCILRYIGPGSITEPPKALLTGPRFYTDLVPGSCIEKWEDAAYVTVVECGEKHRIQVYAVFDLDGDKPPSTREMETKAAKGCDERAAEMWGTKPPKNLQPSFFGPNKAAWEQDERQVICMFEAVNGSLKRSLIPE